MEVMFIKKYVDITTYAAPVEIEITTKGYLLDEVTGRIEIEELNVTLEGVPAGYYAPVK